MMKYIKAPGEIFDLLNLFVFRFNEEAYIKKTLVDPLEFRHSFESVLNGVSINEELYIFFYISENRNSFMKEYFFIDENVDFSNTDFFAIICERIKSMDLFGEILKYYADDIKVIDENIISIDYLYNLFKTIEIPDKIKYHIIHFNFNRSYYTDLLINELCEKYEYIKKYHIKKSKKLSEIKEMLINEKTQNDLCSIAGLKPDFKEIIHFSVSMLQVKMLSNIKNNTSTLILFGCETLPQLEEFAVSKNDIDVCSVSKAMADNLRIDIINLIKEKGELSTSEIAKTFDKGLTAMFYHLNLLYDAKVLNIRNEGRTVYYSVNTGFLRNFSTYIKKFINESDVNL